ncbi:MAG: hypothetical protein LAP38_23150 [Acidobacteriia bacterium]|nr:hypothetical protein [Terriglobia bacterium]
MSVFQIEVRKKRSGGGFFFGIPLFAVWLFLVPLGILCLPFILIASVAGAINPFPAMSALCRILTSLKGTHIELDDDRRTLVLRIA